MKIFPLSRWLSRSRLQLLPEIVEEPDWQTTARSLAVVVATIVVIALASFFVVLIGKELFNPMVNRFEPNQFFTEINDLSYAY